MSQTLQVAPSSGAPRGDATIQPAYFTSSLFVDAMRADIRELERLYTSLYSNLFNARGGTSEANSDKSGPFALFKELWVRLGWQWLHLKVLEPRARETFLKVVLRIFLECIQPTENPMRRVVGLFSLYTFYMSQPSTSVPKSMQSAQGISIPIDVVEELLVFPDSLSGNELLLKPYAQFVLDTLRPAFLILPPSEFQAQNPCVLPREEVRNELLELEELSGNGAGRKKTGRPSKAEKMQRIRATVAGLDQWLENSSYPLEIVPGKSDPAGAAGLLCPDEEASEASIAELTTHVALSERPVASLDCYREKKATAVSLLQDNGRAIAADRAGSRVLRRLKEIDAAAAERGLEVGTEGGELSAIGRVERAVNERKVLKLLEGGGLT